MLLRGELADIASGSVFLFIGLATCAIAGIRRRSGMRIFVWLGIWSAMYGAMALVRSAAFLAALPGRLLVAVPFANAVMSYLIVVVAALSFMELSQGIVRRLLKVIVVAGLAIAVGGIAFFLFTGSQARLILYNNLLATVALLLLTTLVAVPSWSRKYLVLPGRGVLTFGTLVFAVEALYVNLARALELPQSRLLDQLGFAILLFSFGYAALQRVLMKERRLLAVEDELAIAREIQTSILPRSIPEIRHARISATYRPMTAVAGDFYEFIPVDEFRVGCLVADVCGHGVPAALIASMIKVAVQTVAGCAEDPGAVLRGLNHILSGQLRGQLVSAAYLWLDTENGRGLYAAAGHPPLLRWRQDQLEHIESNGLLFGVMADCVEYPVTAVPLAPGDRFLLYTDGVTEPENAAGIAFGDSRLEHVVRSQQSCAPAELSERLLAELRHWQPASVSQQDDITLIVIDAI